MYSTEQRPKPSPTQQINIFNGGGWGDDCDDDDGDYVDMAPVKPQGMRSSSYSNPASSRYPKSPRSPQTPDRLAALKSNATPELVVQPASPRGSLPSSARTDSALSNYQSSDDSSSEAASDSGSDYDDYLTKNLQPKQDVKVNISQKSASKTSIPSPEERVSSPPPLPQRRQTAAGQAARIYLQMQPSRNVTKTEGDSPKSPVGLQRSSSRVGSRGVQNRINRKVASSIRSHSTDELDSVITDEAKKSEAKMKSRTLDRSLSGVKQSFVEENSEVFSAGNRKSNDGSAVMNLISERNGKSQSLDPKYLEFLDGISKHASAPNSPKSTLEKKSKKKDSKKTSKKKKAKDENVDEEEEFRRYAQTMSARAGRTACTASAPDLSIQTESSLDQNLAEFVKERGKTQKNKISLASRFSIRKSKTVNKLVSDRSEITQNPQGQDTMPGKTDSFKKDKRKSWKKKHGFSIKSKSKERIDSDPISPPSSPLTSIDIVDSAPASNGPPQIKPTLGYNGVNSPSLRVKTHQRSNSEYQEICEQYSPKIMSPAAARSFTLDNKRVNKDLYPGHTGSLKSHKKLKKIASYNSENSGSNSDLSGVLDEDFESMLKTGKSGTLSRLSRKLRSAKVDGMDYDASEPQYGSLGRQRSKRGKYATLSGSLAMTRNQKNSEVNLDAMNLVNPYSIFFNSNFSSRGFRIELDDDDDDDEDSDDSDPDNIVLELSFEPARLNKYATLTGGKSYRNSESKNLTKRVSDNSFDARREEIAVPLSSYHSRNRSLPENDIFTKSKNWKGKGFSSQLRPSPSSPSNHLAFGEMLSADVGDIPMDRSQASPLRTRRLQTIEPLLEEPSPKILSAARILYRCLIGTHPELLKLHYSQDEKDIPFDSVLHEEEVIPSYTDSVLGHELVSWLIEQMPNGLHNNNNEIPSSEHRQTATAMLQALLEEGAISHVRREQHFQDSHLLYQFHQDVTKVDRTTDGRPSSVESTVSSLTSDGNSSISNGNNENDDSSDVISRTSSIQSSQTITSENWVPSIVDEQELKEVLTILQKVAPDAMFRMVLRKFPDDRTVEERTMIYEEILHIKALSHLGDSVKRELAGVLNFEFHRKGGKTLFSQGDEGRSWYIIIKGSVHVDIQGQGVVCTLKEGDDFGNLAIINDAPRAATIVLAEDNCQLLRVDKHDFVRILKDVEANTVRLKEHEKDVLILQKIHARSSSGGRHDELLNNNHKANQRLASSRNHHRYAISAGTPSKIVEHVVKSLKPWSKAKQNDEAMEDLILMYQVFTTTQDICRYLMNLYHSETSEQIDGTKSIKRKVVYFVVRWSHIATHIFYDQPAIGSFLKELKQAVQDDEKIYPKLKEDLAQIYASESSSSDSPSHRGWITVESATINRYPQTESAVRAHEAVRATDDVMLKVYNVNGTYTTVKLPILSTVAEILSAVAEKQGRDPSELHLIQVQSDGDMYALPKTMTSAATSLGVNSRLFICSSDEKDDISPLNEQRIIPTNNGTVLELVGSQEIAELITEYDQELINSIHVMEFVHKVFGSHKFHSVTSNIDVFARRFNQLAYWAPTEICTCSNINKRVHLLRKFIKIAQHLKELQNMNAFMAVMIGLGNQALSRMHATWDKLPTKYKKLMTEFEAVLDPSRNHRAYRLHIATLRPPMIPYLPLLMKDMTFQHEGNDSTRNGLINFEKMHMMSNSIRGVVNACCKKFEISPAVKSSKTYEDTRQYTRNFDVITDQKLLNSISGKNESKR